MAAAKRICEREGCGQPVTGRADKRYCADACRLADLRDRRRHSRAEPSRGKTTATRLAAVIRSEPVPTWDPSSQPCQPHETAEPCPDCGKPLTASPRGTWRACVTCRMAAIPAAARAPYARGEHAPQRQVVSQRERDLAALELARRKGLMLAQLGELAADDRLADESRPVVEWFCAEVKMAGSAGRLDELAALLPQAGIRRRRWWQGQPAAIETGWDDGEAQDDGDTGPAATSLRVLPGPPPAPLRPVTPEDALAVLGLTLPLVTPAGGCQVAEAGVRCGAGVSFSIEIHGQLAWLCTRHNYAVCKMLRTGRSA